MNKIELISYVAEASNLSKSDAASAVEAVLSGVTETLKAGESVNLVGFGAFTVSERAARTARNPRTGEPIEVGPSRSPRFKAGKALKDALK